MGCADLLELELLEAAARRAVRWVSAWLISPSLWESGVRVSAGPGLSRTGTAGRPGAGRRRSNEGEPVGQQCAGIFQLGVFVHGRVTGGCRAAGFFQSGCDGMPWVFMRWSAGGCRRRRIDDWSAAILRCRKATDCRRGRGLRQYWRWEFSARAAWLMCLEPGNWALGVAKPSSERSGSLLLFWRRRGTHLLDLVKGRCFYGAVNAYDLVAELEPFG